ncbi:MAG: SusC/RagA family TonB-linked outer membrane protein [Flavobacterium sp.]|nr:MAG: SusC/RagA family TonB-linked outer membrane protein [Flavobacterium sp.]
MKTMYQKFLLLLLMLPLSVLAQSTLSGTVRDNTTGEPIPGVNVVVESGANNASNSTATDLDGNFTLSGLRSGDRIVFSYIGFTNYVQEYTGQSTINVIMQEDATQLDEVVVIGYGTVRKKDATGSLSNVTAKDFNKGAVVTAENLLNGRVAGLTINTSGAPGSGSAIRIRGGASLSASNDPLIVINGLPITDQNAGGATSILASINPNDIESFTVLKDASATAIYGSRASNGVIIITTKKGNQALAVDYNFQYGSGRAMNKIDVFSADQFRAQVAERQPNSVGLLGDANTDWQDAIYRRTDLVDNNISVRGSLFKTIPTRLSVGNTYQEGLRLTNSFNRTTTALSMTPSFFDNHLRINLNANYSNEKNRFADGVEGAAIRFDPTQPIYDDEINFGGFFQYTNNDGQNLTDNLPRNPVASLLQRRNTSRVNRFYGNAEFDYKMHFFPELRAVVNLGFDQSKGEGSNFLPTRSGSGFANAGVPFGSDSEYTSFRKNANLDAYLAYKKEFGNLDFDITGGYNYQKFDAEDFSTGDRRNPASVADVNTQPDIVLVGFFGRTNLSYNDKYLLTLSYRREATSKFGSDLRWGNFPAAAIGWRISEESFLKDSKVLSDLKLKGSWGITGQQNISAAYSYLERYVLSQPTSQYYFGSVPTLTGIGQFRNLDIKWEETMQYNVGLDYGFFGNKITGSIDAFYKESTDLLTFGPVADGSNLGNQGFLNVGSFTTKGLEFSLDAAVVNNDNLQWNVNFNASHYQRKITELINNSDLYVGGISGGTGSTIQILKEGYNPSSFYVYKQLYDADNNPIEGAYADLDGDGIINQNDRYIYKNADPKVTLGFASNLNYKGFDLYFNLRASIGGRLYNNVNSNLAQWDRLIDQSALGNIPTSVQGSNFDTVTDAVLLSDYYIENASFLKMDNITLGYTFSKWLEGQSSVRIYAGMQNVFTITNYSGLDPEIFGGIDNTIYPRPRTFLVGANVKF